MTKASELKIDDSEFSYARQDLKLKFLDKILAELEDGPTRAELARRLGVNRSVLSRRLATPGDWKLSTISDLCRALEREPLIELAQLDRSCTANYDAVRIVMQPSRIGSAQTAAGNPVRLIADPIGTNAHSTSTIKNAVTIGARLRGQ